MVLWFTIGIIFIFLGLGCLLVDFFWGIFLIAFGVLWIKLMDILLKQSNKLKKQETDNLTNNTETISNQSKSPSDEYVIAFKNKIRSNIMNDKKVDAIVCIIIGAILLCIGIPAMIVSSSQENVPEGLVFAIFFGFIFLIIGIYVFNKYKEQEEKDLYNKLNNYKQQQINAARELLISHYMNLAEETFKKRERDNENFFNEKYLLIKDTITAFIIQQEYKYGTVFLTEDIDKNEISRTLNSIIAKQAFAITIYYLLEFDEIIPSSFFSMQEIIAAISQTIDDMVEKDNILDMDDANFKKEVLKRL